MKELTKEDIFRLIREKEDKKKIELYIFNYLINNDYDKTTLSGFGSILIENDMKELLKVITLVELYKIWKDRGNKISETYEKSNNAYNEIITKTNVLAKELNITNSLELSLLFSYLLYTGHFSITAEHNYKIEKRRNIPNHFSFDIFHGGGVCLNYSEMLTDILVKADYQAATIINYANIDKVDAYRPNIERKIIEPQFGTKIFSGLMGPVAKKYGNHACSLIFEHENPYIYDVTNLTMFECVDNKLALHKLGRGTLTLNPYFSTLISKNDVNLETIRKFCLTEDYNSPYHRNKFMDIAEKCIDIFNQNEDLLKDFHSDIYKEISTIVKETEQPKKLKSLIKV